jgi:hypothetical protein
MSLKNQIHVGQMGRIGSSLANVLAGTPLQSESQTPHPRGWDGENRQQSSPMFWQGLHFKGNLNSQFQVGGNADYSEVDTIQPSPVTTR